MFFPEAVGSSLDHSSPSIPALIAQVAKLFSQAKSCRLVCFFMAISWIGTNRSVAIERNCQALLFIKSRFNPVKGEGLRVLTKS